jgi:hypothetical protein
VAADAVGVAGVPLDTDRPLTGMGLAHLSRIPGRRS